MSNEDDDIEQFTGELGRMFTETFSSMGASLFGPFSANLRPLSRVRVDNDSVTVTFDLPGVSKEGVSVVCTQDFVSIEAEGGKQASSVGKGRSSRSVEYVKYSERVALPVLVDPDRGSAKFRNGIIVVKVPRLRSGRQLKITGAQDKGR
jgi:HSP20 family molecular chaperone IbpA